MKQVVQILVLIVIEALTLCTYAQDQQVLRYLYVTGVAWSHDGSRIAAVGNRPVGEGYGGYIRIVDAQTQQVLYASDPNTISFTVVDWSPDDRFLDIGGYDANIHILDTQNYEMVAILMGHQSTVTDIDWSPDGTRFVSTGS